MSEAAKEKRDEEEYKKYKKIADKIDRQITHVLPSRCQEEYPFVNPYYWAGFISQGLA